MKNFLAVTLLALGTPMLLMGDEVRRTQGGNNNAYCQDNEISWFDWRLLERHADVHRFVRLLLAARLKRDMAVEDPDLTLNQLLGQARLEWHGVRLGRPDWGDESHSIALTAWSLTGRFAFHLMVNAWREPLAFELPAAPQPPAGRWRRWIDTSLPSPDDIVPAGGGAPGRRGKLSAAAALAGGPAGARSRRRGLREEPTWICRRFGGRPSWLVRAGVGAGLSAAVALQFDLKYPIYAFIAAVIVTDLSPSRTRQLGLLRLVATVVGAGIGAMLSMVLPPGPLALGLGVLIAMQVCHLVHLQDGAKVAGYICGIVLLEHGADAWSYAFHSPDRDDAGHRRGHRDQLRADADPNRGARPPKSVKGRTFPDPAGNAIIRVGRDISCRRRRGRSSRSGALLL